MTSRRLETPIVPTVEAYTYEIIKSVSINYIGKANDSSIYRLSTFVGLGRERDGVVEYDNSTFKEYYIDVFEQDVSEQRNFEELSDFIVEQHKNREETEIAENIVRKHIDIGNTRI